jgi:hypothetical protein
VGKFVIRSKSQKRYRVLLRGTNRKHAKTVLKNLRDDLNVPSDLKLRRKFRG